MCVTDSFFKQTLSPNYTQITPLRCQKYICKINSINARDKQTYTDKITDKQASLGYLLVVTVDNFHGHVDGFQEANIRTQNPDDASIDTVGRRNN